MVFINHYSIVKTICGHPVYLMKAVKVGHIYSVTS